jgi:hypothetical protein
MKIKPKGHELLLASIRKTLAAGGTPARQLWRHLTPEEQRPLVLESLRKELKWLGAPVGGLTGEQLYILIKEALRGEITGGS